jgi:hypothetical protein
MKRFMMFCSGLLLTFSMTGCCLLGHGGGCGPCGGGGYGAAYPYSGGGGCPGGACGASAQGYPQAFNGGAYSQAAFVPGAQTAFIEPMPTF